MVNRNVMKSEHDLFIDCLPYEWRSGTSDDLFLPIYPPRSIRIVLWFLITSKFLQQVYEFFWLILSPWIIRTLSPFHFASLYYTVQLSPVPYTHHLPSSKQPPYLPIMAFPEPFWDVLPCNFPPFRLLWHTSSLSYCSLHDHVVYIVFVARPPS